MSVIDQATVTGRPRTGFAREHDIDEFVDVLGKYERGEISAEDWRKFRLVRGTYGQRQDGVQMMRIKIPQGILTSAQLQAEFMGLAGDFVVCAIAPELGGLLKRGGTTPGARASGADGGRQLSSIVLLERVAQQSEPESD